MNKLTFTPLIKKRRAKYIVKDDGQIMEKSGSTPYYYYICSNRKCTWEYRWVSRDPELKCHCCGKPMILVANPQAFELKVIDG